MDSFEEICNEIIVLSDTLYKHNFRVCFVEHISDKVKTLNELISDQQVDIANMKRLQLKLLEPVMFHLRNSVKSSDKCSLIQYLIYILNLVPISNAHVFFHLYFLIFSQVLNKGKTNEIFCEELKLIVLEAGCCLIKKSTQNVIEQVFRQESGEKLSIGIFIAIENASKERSIKLRLQALDFLLNATHYKTNLNYKKIFYTNLGDLFMLYLPGLIAPLQEIILKDETQHHLITVKALMCWQHVICLVLCDLRQEKQLTENESIKLWMNSNNKSYKNDRVIDVSKALVGKKRTKTWLSAAAITLNPLIMKITEVRKHSNAKCRFELTKAMVKLLQNCAVNLEASLGPVIEVIVSSTCDNNQEVCQISVDALKEFESESNSYHRTFISVIENNLYTLINKLPGVIHSSNEKLILPSLRSFSGYLNILGKVGKLHQLLALSTIFKKLLFVIKISFEMQLYPEISNKEFSSYDKDQNLNVWSKSWKKFRYHTDESIKKELEGICHHIGEYSDSETLIDCLLESYVTETYLQKEVLLVLNQTILTLKEVKDHVIIQLMDFYLNEEYLYLPLLVDNENCCSLNEANSNIVTVVLIMEGLGNLAQRLGKKFCDYLLMSLYYIIEQIGSNFLLISEEATRTAISISNACGLEGNVNLLIKQNMDYLTYHAVTKLKKSSRSGVFDVLSVLIRNSTVEAVSSLEEMINNVLKTSSKNLNSHLTLSYLRLFETFVVCVRKWVGEEEREVRSKESNDQLIQELITSIKKREEERKATDAELEFEKESETKMAEEDEDELNEEFRAFQNVQETEKPPKHITTTVAIASHCLHFLASKDRNKKLVVLTVLNESLLILAKWENELLPLVHKIWSPLITRFDQMNDPVLIKFSFSLLCTLAKTSKQFIRSRTLKSVLPTLQSFLLKEAPKSRLKDSGYYFTQSYKLQRELLENLGNLTTDLELFERQTDLIVDSSLPYLSVKQPKELQEKCRGLFNHLKNYDPYLIWFKLHTLTMDPEFAPNVRLILDE